MTGGVESVMFVLEGFPMPRHEDDEIDWGGLVAVGSLLGNLLQYSQTSQLEQRLGLTDQQLRALAADRERILNGLNQMQRAYESLKQDAEGLRQKNRELVELLGSKDQEILKLKDQIIELLKREPTTKSAGSS